MPYTIVYFPPISSDESITTLKQEGSMSRKVIGSVQLNAVLQSSGDKLVVLDVGATVSSELILILIPT